MSLVCLPLLLGLASQAARDVASDLRMQSWEVHSPFQPVQGDVDAHVASRHVGQSDDGVPHRARDAGNQSSGGQPPFWQLLVEDTVLQDAQVAVDTGIDLAYPGGCPDSEDVWLLTRLDPLYHLAEFVVVPLLRPDLVFTLALQVQEVVGVARGHGRHDGLLLASRVGLPRSGSAESVGVAVAGAGPVLDVEVEVGQGREPPL